MKQQGFTLVEILVVVGVISIMAGVITFSTVGVGQSSRDADRQADLRIVESALELYKLKYGRYPAGCNGDGVWSGQIGTSYQCSATDNTYIVGHTAGVNFAPEFIAALPQDQKLNGSNSGYVYTTNSGGTTYKFMAKNTVESESVDVHHPFRSCDITTGSAGMCTASAGGDSLNGRNSWCDPNDAGNNQFDISYAVWGGLAPATSGNTVEVNTEAIICDIQ